MPADENPNPDEHPTTNNLVSAHPTADQSAHGAEHSDGEELRIATRREILYKLQNLPGLAALGRLTPACANAMRAAYDTMLRHLGDPSASGAPLVADEDVLSALRSAQSCSSYTSHS